jgi:hypothetical protein
MQTLENLIELEKQGKLVGEFKNLSSEIYHHPECPGFSRSDLSLINRSWLHYQNAKHNKSEPALALEFGSSFHDLILLPNEFKKKNCRKADKPFLQDIPSFGRTKAELQSKADWIKEIQEPFNRDVLEPWEAENNHKIQWKEEHWIDLMEMQKNCLEHLNLQALMKYAEFENTYFWKDPKTGILLKCRPDIINKDLGILVDLKTTSNASMPEFQRSIANFQYDAQAAFYLDGVNQSLGLKKRFDSFIFAVIEKTPPYGIILYNLDEASIDVGRELIKKYLNKLNDIQEGKCEKTYPKEIININLPAYGFNLDSR